MTAFDCVVMESYTGYLDNEELIAIEGVGENLVNAWNKAVKTVQDLFKKIKDAIQKIARSVTNAVKNAYIKAKGVSDIKKLALAEHKLSQTTGYYAIKVSPEDAEFIIDLAGAQDTVNGRPFISVGNLEDAVKKVRQRYELAYTAIANMRDIVTTNSEGQKFSYGDTPFYKDPKQFEKNLDKMLEIMKDQKRILKICSNLKIDNEMMMDQFMDKVKTKNGANPNAKLLSAPSAA